MYVKYGYSLSTSAIDGVDVCCKHFSSAPGSVCVSLCDRVCARRAQFACARTIFYERAVLVFVSTRHCVRTRKGRNSWVRGRCEWAQRQCAYALSTVYARGRDEVRGCKKICKCTVVTTHKRHIKPNDCCTVRARSAVCVRILGGLMLVKYGSRAA